ncbi:MAG: DUF3362 domain-containing protein, partial [Clostridia bacterium]|nr:DUF3362 domain-containing protein [Clostridia bacterium]
RPENAPLVREALTRAGRQDLIGYGQECLVRPERQTGYSRPADKKRSAPGKKGGRYGDKSARGTRNSEKNARQGRGNQQNERNSSTPRSAKENRGGKKPRAKR